MLQSGATPNAFTFPFVLKSSASLSLPITGKQLHCHVFKLGCESEPFVQTALISMYCRCNLTESAQEVFDEIPQRSLTVCYNALISGYVQNCNFLNGFSLFTEMRQRGIAFNAVTFGIGSRLYWSTVSVVGNVLALKLFDHIPEKGLITWNAMISGYAQNGLAAEVLELYHEMELLQVLSACANLGAQKIGLEVEEKIRSSARIIFDEMPEKNLVSWTAIIGGYGIHGFGNIAVELFDKMIKTGIQPDGTVFVSVLSACSHAGLTKKGVNYLDLMKREYGLKPCSEHYSCIVDLLGR
ncbi:hypothetical protein HAX54_001122 [Datura stramonium]|uniref:Pentatricopeptide repeat-containing protein n=1 Tax=Datura stramonium TaxID=4076 RepID=A0ABS8RSP7_DATST|nr:hypothetical protein [Datura stramonium]